MVLDIELFRAEKGGQPDVIRKSQKDRYKDVTLVDKVIDADERWRQRKNHFLINYINFYFTCINLTIASFSVIQGE